MAEETDPPADAADRLFRIVATLAEDHPLGPDGASDLTGVALELVPEHTSPSFAVYSADAGADGLLREVEFRTPYSADAPEGRRATSGEFTILRVHPEAGVDADDIVDEYGDPRGPIPEHHMIMSDPPAPPPDDPLYLYIYERPWGEISFGVRDDCVVRAIVDVEQAPKR